MRKQLIALAIVLALAAVLIACGRNAETTGYVEPAMEGFTIAETTSELSTESALQAAESELAEQTEAAISFSDGTKSQTTATNATQKATAAQSDPATPTQAMTARPVTAAQMTTTTQRTTTMTTPAPQTQPQKPVYTEADYAEIIAAVREYAESKALPFIWDTSLTYEYAQSGRAGFHDVVNLNQNGKDGTIKTLKYNADQTELRGINGSGGVPATEVHYNVVWLEYQSEPYFALIYG